MTQQLRVVIVNWNAGELLRACLESFGQAASHTGILERVVVIDNASEDDSLDGTERAGPPLEIQRNPVNRGYSAACNQAILGCQADYLLFLNPDVRLFPDSLTAPLAFLEDVDNSDVGILGIQLLDEQGILQRSCSRFPTPWRIFGQSLGLDRLLPGLVAPHFMREWAHDETRPVDQIMGAYFLVRRQRYEALGGFDERFFVYFDDVDFCLRARRQEWRTVYFTGASAMHIGCGTTAAVPALRLFYLLRSRLRFARKHFRPAGRVIVLLATILLEPLSRLARAAGRGSVREARHVATAVVRLWGTALPGRDSRRS